MAKEESDSDSSGSDCGMDMDTSVPFSEEEATALEAQLAEQKMDYGSHLALWAQMKRCDDFDRVKRNRSLFAECFPLTDELWKEWLASEARLASGVEEKKEVVDLYQRALKDYQSVDLWVGYLNFCDDFEDEYAAEKMRGVFEEALTAAGSHLIEGHKIWDAYREFEIDNEETAEDDASKAKHTEKIRKLYQRHLSFPHEALDDVLEQYTEWEGENGGTVPPHVGKECAKAKAEFAKRQPFEQRLVAARAAEDAPAQLTVVWNEYLDFEEKAKNVSSAIGLYERAVKEKCLDPELWTRYTTFLDTTLKIASVTLPACARAVRNCTWVASLWTAYIRTLEKAGRVDEIPAVTDRAIACGLSQGYDYMQVFEAECDALRRAYSAMPLDASKAGLKTSLQRAAEFIETHYGDADPECTMRRWWARVECAIFKDTKASHELWKGIIVRCGRSPAVWLEFLLFCRDHLEVRDARTAFKQAVHKLPCGSEAICQAWMLFEREVGTIEEWEAAKAKVDVKMAELNQRAWKAMEISNQQAEAMAQKETELNDADEKKKEKERERKKKLEQLKRKRGGAALTAEESLALKKQRVSGGSAVPVTDSGAGLDPARAVTPPRQVQPVKRSVDSKETLFVCNLSFETKEGDLRVIFQKEPGFKDIRLIVNTKGQSKGFAYADFTDEESAKAAQTTLSGKMINGRELTLKVSEPPKPQATKAAATKNLFVVNVAPEVQEAAIRELFEKCGAVTEVRLVRDRDGVSKGFAYVDFENEDGGKAGLALHDSEFAGRTLEVKPSTKPASGASGRGGSAVIPEATLRKNKAAVLALQPRSVGKASGVRPKGKFAAGSKAASSAAAPTTQQGDATAAGSDKPLSNKDFRSFLLKK